MAKKQRGAKPQREPTKRQLSRWQQHKRRQLIILSAGIFTVVAVLAILAVGWYITQYQPLRATAIVVNDTKFNMQYYIDMLRVQGSGQSSQYMSYIADLSIKGIEQEELIEQEALKLGITVSDDDVRQKIKSSGITDDAVHRDLIRTQLLTDKMKADYFDKQVPATASQAHIMAMLLESEQQATEARARLENGESFADLAVELSLDSLTKQDKGDLGWHTEDAFATLLGTKIPGEYAFGSEAGILSQPRYDEGVSKPAGYWLIKVLDRPADTKEAHVDAMMLSSQQQAQEVRARLEAGEDFTALAKEFSQLSTAKDNGGDLGLLGQGIMGAVFDDFVFNPDTETGTLSELLRDDGATTQGGYWLIDVLEKEDNRPISDSDRESLKERALNDWASSLLLDPSNTIDDSYLDANRKAWAVNQALKG